MFDCNKGRSDLRKRTKSTLVLNNLLKASCKLCMSKRVGFSTPQQYLYHWSSAFLPRATEPKIPSLVIPKLSPNCCLKLANFSKHSCNLTNNLYS